MNVLIDTSVWSLALRRRSEQLNAGERRLVDEWKSLIREGRARLIGIVRQEVLSGIRNDRDFERVRERLVAVRRHSGGSTHDHEEAARLFNRCRVKGVTGAPIDLLICAIARRCDLAVFTTDRDFERYRPLLGVELHTVPE